MFATSTKHKLLVHIFRSDVKRLIPNFSTVIIPWICLTIELAKAKEHLTTGAAIVADNIDSPNGF